MHTGEAELQEWKHAELQENKRPINQQNCVWVKKSPLGISDQYYFYNINGIGGKGGQCARNIKKSGREW